MPAFADRELLRRAWPGGLQRRGVESVTGWRCFQVLGPDDEDRDPHGPPEQAGWENIEETPHSYNNGGMEVDDMLPALDPIGDPATWACALVDLAEAAGQPPGTFWCLQPSADVAHAVWAVRPVVHVGSGGRVDKVEPNGFLGWTRWTLLSFRPRAFNEHDLTDYWRHFDFDAPVKDDAEALVRARIHLRKKDAR